MFPCEFAAASSACRGRYGRGCEVVLGGGHGGVREDIILSHADGRISLAWSKSSAIIKMCVC